MFFVCVPEINTILMLQVRTFVQIYWELVLLIVSQIKMKNNEAKIEPFLSSSIYQVKRYKNK